MKQEFKMTQEEMDNIIAINKGGGDPVVVLDRFKRRLAPHEIFLNYQKRNWK